MLFGGHHREEQVSPFCPRWNNVRTVAPVEGSAVPCTSGAQQKIVDTVACSPLPNSSLARASVSSDQWSYGQKTFLTRQNFYRDPSSSERDCQWHLSNAPTLLELLTTKNGNDEFPLSHQSKATAWATAETSISSTNSKTIPSGRKQYLDDDQILQLIEKKLAIFRAQMKVFKGSNSRLLSSCQDPASSTSAPGTFDGGISKDRRENKDSDSSRQSLERSTMKNDGTVTAKQPTGTPLSNSSFNLPFFDKNTLYIEFPPSKDPCIAEEYTDLKDSCGSPANSVLTNISSIRYSLTALKELISSFGNVETPCKEIFVDSILQTYWSGKLDNVHLFTSTEYVGIMQEAAAICSKKEEESPVVLQAPGSCATIDELVKRSPALTLHYKPSNQEYESVWRNKDPSDLSKPTQTSVFETSNANCMYELKDPKYDDLTDEETPQHSTLNTPLQNKVICEDHLTVQLSDHLANPASESVDINLSMSIQLDDTSDDEGQIDENGSIQVETSKVPEQNFILEGTRFAKANRDPAATPSSKQQLVCTCYYAEYDDEDDLKLVECQKCLNVSSLNQKENTSPRQECESEDFEDVGLATSSFQHMDSQCEEDDEWIVIPLVASDVKLESQYPSSHEQRDQHSQSCFQKIPVFDDIFCFHEALSKEMNCTFTPEATNSANFELLPASCNFLKQDVAEKSASEPALNPGTEAEDSCDTDNSSDYPLLTNRNYLTAPSRVRAPSFLVSSSDSEDEGEVLQPPETITPRPPPESSSFNNFFPVLSADEDEDNTNNVVNGTTVASRVTKRLCKKALSNKEKRQKTKNSKKKRPKSSKLNQESNLRQMGNSSESGKDSTLPNQPAVQLGYIKSSPAQNCKNSSSVTNKEPRRMHKTQAVKRKSSSTTSTSDCNRKDQGKRKRPSHDAAGSLMLKRPDNAIANHKANTPNTNASEARKKQPLPNQRSSTLSKSVYPIKTPESRGCPVTETLSLNGERYQASSLPGGHKQTNQVNSYSTTKSTPAKQKLVKEWASVHVPTPKERKSSFDRDVSARNPIAKAANGKDHEMRDHAQCLARHRSNSRETPLSKRTKIEAREYTHNTHRQASTELDPDKRYSAYKWRCKGTPATNDFNWERERDSPELPKGLTEL